ncbi:unnamed protein product, partial [marine sediment metagenome]
YSSKEFSKRRLNVHEWVGSVYTLQTLGWVLGLIDVLPADNLLAMLEQNRKGEGC